MFAAAKPETSTSLFGNKPDSSSSTGSLFGNKSGTSGGAAGSLFGSKPEVSKTGLIGQQPATGGFSFSAKSTAFTSVAKSPAVQVSDIVYV